MHRITRPGHPRPLLAATLAALQLAFFCAPACRADADPDADPDRAPRVRGLPIRASAFEGDYSAAGDAGGNATFLAFVVDPIQTLGCTGGSAIGFSIDASSSIVPVEFSEMQAEVSRFIVETDDAAVERRNLYYANTFGTLLEETTAGVEPGAPDFDPNQGDAVSNAVLGFSPRKGAGNIAAGLVDLASRFADLDDPAYAGIAVLVTDSRAAPAGPLSLAVASLKAATQARLGIDVTVVVVGVGGQVDAAELRQIASEGADGGALVFEVDFFDDISISLEDALANIDTDGDGVSDCLDGCPADPRKTEPGLCGCGIPEEECPTECRGLFGFSLATSACFGSGPFSDALGQVAEFVNASSGFATGSANPNLYYANAVNHRVHSSTGLFDRNTAGDIAAAIRDDLSFIPGGVNIAAGLEDLRGRLGAGALAQVTFARFAVVVTDGFDDPAAVSAAAASLKADDVTVIVVAPAGANDRRNLEAIASSPALVLEVTAFDDIAPLLLSTIAEIDTDGDGTVDCEDACPTDPDKVVPGVCGCLQPVRPPCL